MAAWARRPGLLVGTVVFAAAMSLLYPALLLLALGGAPETRARVGRRHVQQLLRPVAGLGSLIVGRRGRVRRATAARSRAGAVCALRRVRRAPVPHACDGGAALASTRPARSRPSTPVRDVAARDQRLPAEGRRDPVVPLRAVASAPAARDDRAHDAVRRRGGVGRGAGVPGRADAPAVPAPDASARPRASTRSRARSAPTSSSSTRCCRSASSARGCAAAPYVVVAHGAEITVYGRLPGSRPARRGGCCAARPAIVAAGEYPARDRGARRRPRRSRRSSIPPGVDPARFRPLDADAAPRRRARRFGLDPDAPLVLGVSRLVPRKGFDVLLDAVARARRRAGRDRRRPGATARGSNGARGALGDRAPLPRPRRRRRPARAVRVRRRVRDVCRDGGAGSRPRDSASCSSRRRRAACPRSRGAAVVRTKRSSTARPGSSSSRATCRRCAPRSTGCSRDDALRARLGDAARAPASRRELSLRRCSRRASRPRSPAGDLSVLESLRRLRAYARRSDVPGRAIIVCVVGRRTRCSR